MRFTYGDVRLPLAVNRQQQNASLDFILRQQIKPGDQHFAVHVGAAGQDFVAAK